MGVLPMISGIQAKVCNNEQEDLDIVHNLGKESCDVLGCGQSQCWAAMKRFLQRFERVLDSPYALLFISAVLLFTSASEIAETLDEDIRNRHLRAGHGVFCFGLYGVLQALPHVFESLDKFIEAHRMRGENSDEGN